MQKVILRNTNISDSGKKKWNRPENIWVLLLCTITFLLGYLFHEDHGGFSDVARYYDMMEEFFSGSESIVYVIGVMLAYGHDFIYYLLLFLFAKTPLGMQFVTGVVAAIYFYLLIRKFSHNITKINSTNLTILLGLFCFANVVYVITISRITLAIVFFFIGILFYEKERYLLTFLFFLFAVLSHFASLMFVAVFLLTVILYKLFLNHSAKIVNGLCVVLPPLMFILGVTFFNSLLNGGILSFLHGDDHYGVYVVNAEGSAQYDNFSWSYHLQFIFSMIYSYVILNMIKENSFKRVLLLIVLSITAAFATANQNLFNRWLIVLPLIFSLHFTDMFKVCIANVQGARAMGKRKIIYIGSLISIVLFLFLIYGTRTYFI